MPRTAIPADAFNHGDHRRYHRGCRCTRCTQAATKAAQRWQYLRETGRGTFVTPDRAADHIRFLRAAGMADSEIITSANLCPDLLYSILRNARRIHRKTENRVLAVPIPTSGEMRSEACVSALGTTRRLQTLTANGWPATHLAKRIGKHAEYVRLLIQGVSPQVRLVTAHKVRNLYTELADQSPEGAGVHPRYIQQCRDRATANNWPTGDYWDDDDFDNPDFQPAMATVIELKRDQLGAIRREEILHLAACGLSHDEIQQRLQDVHGRPLSLSHIRNVIREQHQPRDRSTKAAA